MGTSTRGFGGKVATQPFPKSGVEVKATNGFATIQNRSTLTGLAVIYGNEDGSIQPGDTVWVRSDGAKSWGLPQTIGEEGSPVAIVPPEYIMLVTRNRKDLEPYVRSPVPLTPAPFPGQPVTP